VKRALLILAALFLLSSNVFPQLTLKVEIKGLRNNNGKIMIQLYSGDQKVLDERICDISGQEGKVTFNDLKPGKYAVRFYHDENMNRKMETNLVGKPTEGYGFSNNVTERFSMPSFEKWLFDMAENKTVIIQAVY
jgi:uncharacterized protein (DUF2141 family)